MVPSPKLYTLDDVTLSVSGWAKRLGLSPKVMRYRLRNWPIERALTEPPNHRLLTHGGVTKSAAKWAREAGITQQVLTQRLARGWSLAKVLKWGDQTPPRQSRTYTIGDRTMTMQEWAEASGMSRATLFWRMRDQGMTLEQAVSTAPFATVQRFSDIEVDGEQRTLEEWAKKLGMTKQAVSSRMKDGWTFEEAVTTPKGQLPPRLSGRPKGRPQKPVTWGGITRTMKEWKAITGRGSFAILSAIVRGEAPPVKP